MRSTPEHPLSTTRSRRRRVAVLALAAASLAGGALSLAAAPAGAQLSTGGPSATYAPAPNPCAYLISCPVSTTYSFHHAGYYAYAAATFPQGASGTVSFRMHCADGFSKTKSVAISPYINVNMTVKDEHPGSQTCTMTQTVKKGFTTTVALLPPDSDELWPVEYVKFTNV
jgi:hypothetical protein